MQKEKKRYTYKVIEEEGIIAISITDIFRSDPF